MTTIAKARKAARAAKKVLNRSIKIKKCEGIKGFTICIGHTDRDDERAYTAIAKAIGYESMGFGKIEVCADSTGCGISTVEVI